MLYVPVVWKNVHVGGFDNFECAFAHRIEDLVKFLGVSPPDRAGAVPPAPSRPPAIDQGTTEPMVEAPEVIPPPPRPQRARESKRAILDRHIAWLQRLMEKDQGTSKSSK